MCNLCKKHRHFQHNLRIKLATVLWEEEFSVRNASLRGLACRYVCSTCSQLGIGVGGPGPSVVPLPPVGLAVLVSVRKPTVHTIEIKTVSKHSSTTSQSAPGSCPVWAPTMTDFNNDLCIGGLREINSFLPGCFWSWCVTQQEQAQREFILGVGDCCDRLDHVWRIVEGFWNFGLEKPLTRCSELMDCLVGP